MGFPIRKFSDQSLFAAPQDLSQRTTSFIASQRQGIHQIPLRHLIVLITKTRIARYPSRQTEPQRALVEKTSFASNTSGSPSGQARPTTENALIKRVISMEELANMNPRSQGLATLPSHRHGPTCPEPDLSTECVSSSQCQRVALAKDP